MRANTTRKSRPSRTTVADATGKDGTTTSDEKWVDVSRAQYQAMEKDLGMAIEHKPAGKYDTESERVAQPAGFAYMAPPGQSNQYGHWEQQSNGTSFWVFYGQYALMRDLLFNHSYRPLDYREYHDYYTYRQRNETYYGRDTATQAPKYGTAGTATQERYSGSTFAKSGGFQDSKYASKPGRISRFAVLHADGQGSQRRSQSAQVRHRRQPVATACRAAALALLPARSDALSSVHAAQSGTKFRTSTLSRDPEIGTSRQRWSIVNNHAPQSQFRTPSRHAPCRRRFARGEHAVESAAGPCQDR